MDSPEQMEIDRPPPTPEPPDSASKAKRKTRNKEDSDQLSPSQQSPDYKSPRKTNPPAPAPDTKVVTPQRKPYVQQTLQGAFIAALEQSQKEKKAAQESSRKDSSHPDSTPPSVPPAEKDAKARSQDSPQGGEEKETDRVLSPSTSQKQTEETEPPVPKAPNIDPKRKSALKSRQKTSIPTQELPPRVDRITEPPVKPPPHPPESTPLKHILVTNESKTSNPQPRIPPSYATIAKAAAHLAPPLLPQWKMHRFAVTFEIKMPKDRSKRTEYIATELNKLIQTIAKVSKVYVRKYKTHHIPRDNERKEWIKQFKPDSTSELTLYTHGFYLYQALRDGVFRLQIQLILPVSTDVAALLLDVNGTKWACKKSRSIRDIREQNLYDPKYLGWFFRSNYSMVNSTELQDEFEKLAKRNGTPMSFGLTFKTIPNSNTGQPYNKDTAIKAVCVSTNAEHQGQGWDILMQWYNSKSPRYPLHIPLMFVPAKDHPDIRNNPIASQNVSTLTERQQIFLRDTETILCSHLADPTMVINATGKSLRTTLMKVTARVSPEYNGGNLFHAITQKCTGDGEVSFHVTYHKCVEKEAKSIIGAMGQFIQAELHLDPEDFCHPHLLDSTHKWDPVSRCATNNTTDYLSFLVDNTQEYAASTASSASNEVDETDAFSMDTKGKRESKRVTQIDDSETVGKTLKEKKKKRENKSKSISKSKDVPKEIAESQSVISEITNGTKFSSASQASAVRKELRATVDKQEEALEEKEEALAAKEKELSKLREAMKKMMKQEAGEPPISKLPPAQTSEVVDLESVDQSQQSSGEGGSEEGNSNGEVSDIQVVDPPANYVKPTSGFKLPYLFRGPESQVVAVQKVYDQRCIKTWITSPNSSGYVELHKLSDNENSTESQIPAKDAKQGVSFDPYKRVAEFDPQSMEINNELDEVSLDASNSSGSKQSVGSASSSSSSSSSSVSSSDSSKTKGSQTSRNSNSDSDLSSIPPASKKSKFKSKTESENKPSSRISSITNDIIQAAKQVAVQLSNTNGGGPEDDV